MAYLGEKAGEMKVVKPTQIRVPQERKTPAPVTQLQEAEEVAVS